MNFFERSSKNIVWHTLLLLIVLLVVSWFSISTLVFWSADTGLRYLQVRELIDNQWQGTWIDYPARPLDPELQLVPYYYAFVVVAGRIFVEVGSFFPFVASLLVAVVGRLGLVLVPVLGGVASGLAIYKLAGLIGVKRSALIMWASVLATPLLFYSVEFWDHTFVLAFSLWAFYFMAAALSSGKGRHLFVAGILAAIAWVQRPEYAVYVAAIALAWFIVSRFKIVPLFAFAAGNLVSVVPLYIMQYIWFGHPMGVTYAPILFGYGYHQSFTFPAEAAEPISGRTIIISRFLTYIEARDAVTFIATLASFLGLVLVVLALRVPRWRSRKVVLAGFLITIVGYLLWCVAAVQVHMTGLLPMLGLLPFALAVIESNGAEQSDEHRIYRFILIGCILFIAILVPIWPGFGGHHWASRYLLPVYPLFTLLAFYALEHYTAQLPELRTILSISFAVLLGLSLFIQLTGVYHLFRDHAADAEIRDGLQALAPEVIITNSPFLASEMTSLDKTFLYIDDVADFDALIPRMWENDVREFTVVEVVELPMTVPEHVGDITVREIEPYLYELEGPGDTGTVSQE